MLAFLANAAIYIVPILVILTFIVTIHELGHFLTARAFGVAVDRFSIGFGRALVSFKDRWGVEWRVGWLPLGGYVRFAGDENDASVPDVDDLESLRRQIVAKEGAGAEMRYLYFKPLWQRALVVAAGPAANFVLAIVLFALLFGTVGEPVTPFNVASIVPGSAAERSGFQVGDHIVAADGHAIRGFEDLQQFVAYRSGVSVDFTVERAGKPIHLIATPGSRQVKSVFGGAQQSGLLGVGPGNIRERWVHYDPISAIGEGASQTWNSVDTTLFYLGRMITGHVGADQLHGLVGMAKASGGITKQAVADSAGDPMGQFVSVILNMVNLGALISITIGLANLMPIPVLDGGHLLFYAYEGVVRRPLSANIQAASYRVGLALLVGMMLFANWNDLQRLQLFQFLGSLFS